MFIYIYNLGISIQITTTSEELYGTLEVVG